MQLIAWRTTIYNPCSKPPEFISIAPQGVRSGAAFFPWVIPLAVAEEMFGKEMVAEIGQEPVSVHLTLEPSVEVADG